MYLALDDEGVTFEDLETPARRLLWAELEEVYVETTDAGPWQVDAFYVLVGPHGDFRIPQDLPGCDLLLRRLQALPNFDNQAVIDAMACTENEQFTCWKR